MENSNVISISNHKKKRNKMNQTNNKSYDEVVSETYADQLADEFRNLLEKERETSNTERRE
ncbi:MULTISPECIES: hypothetical protein [unclassified Clostridium]|uniref:hypothetical protein n=1 Tax=unclassified Clostridium TaxID=2614128 RepID=UPI003F91CA8D